MNVTPQMIITAYDNLADALDAWKTVEIELSLAKCDLDTAHAQALASGQIEGRNQEQRAAAARELLADLFATVAKLEIEAAEARLAHDLAYIQRKKVDKLIDIHTLQLQPA